MIRKKCNQDCAPDRRSVKANKPIRPLSRGEFKRVLELKMFGIQIYKITTVVVGQKLNSKDCEVGIKKYPVDIGVAIVFAGLFAILVEVAKRFGFFLVPGW